TVAGLPVILNQRRSQLAVVGTNVSLTVTASGTGPLRYQWRFNGLSLTEFTTAPTLTLSNVQVAQGGEYSVVVSNSLGGTASPEALLLVGEPPQITGQSPAMTVYAGDPVGLSVFGTGYPQPVYQWLRNGQPLPGQTGSYLSLLAGPTNATENYSVTLSNAFGVVTSSVIALTVIAEPPVLVVSPVSQTVVVSQYVELSALATGHPNPVYQWRLEG